MDKSMCIEAMVQLQEYTVEVQKLLGINPVGKKRNSYGLFVDGQPTGAVTHFTASNQAKGPKRPYGRLPVLLERFKSHGEQGVGCQFVMWDDIEPRFDSMRARYPLINTIPAEMFCFGFDEAYWHAGWANRWAYGIEVRNCGQLQRQSNGAYYWNHGKIRYRGKPPIKVGYSHWEPFSWSQMVGTLWIHRVMSTIYDIQPERFLGHVHLTSTRTDPGPHFPIHEMREFALLRKDWPLLQAPFLLEFAERRDAGFETAAFDDPLVSEDSLHQGMYRHDWDGVPGKDEFDLTPMVNVPGAVEAAVSELGKPDLLSWAKSQLRSTGYYVGSVPNEPTPDPEFLEALRIFQARWKKGRSGKPNMVQEMNVTGKIDKKTVKLIKRFTKQMDML